MKICIVSVHKVKNFGSALLCYATQLVFKQAGFEEIEFINIKRGRMEEADSLKEFQVALADDLRNNLQLSNLQKVIFFCAKIPSMLKKAKVFNRFSEKYLKCSPVYENEAQLYLKPPEADIYCTGGDQMWNEMYNGHRTYLPFYLDFAPSSIPRVSFATSFGKDTLENWEIQEVNNLLNRYSYITVREESGKKILEKMNITNVKNILDPTLVLDGEAWREFSQKKEMYKGFILVYRVSRESQVLKIAKKLAHYTHRKLAIISYNIEDKLKSTHSIFVPSPEEFVGLIDAAEYIVTDSFHATAFSINLNKNFIAVLPPKTSTRIENIVRLCGLEKRIWYEKADIRDYLENISYEYTNKILRDERSKALDAAKVIFNIAKEWKDKGCMLNEK